MHALFTQFAQDEAGFIVSSELVLIATIVVLAMVVGLTEVSYAVNEELEDVGSAFGAVSQSFCFSGASGCKGQANGSHFRDHIDTCDSQWDISCDGGQTGER